MKRILLILLATCACASAQYAPRPAAGGGGGSGDALVADPLSQFAATTSAQLAGVLSNETGSGLAVFGTSPTFTTPLLGTPTSGVMTNVTGTAAGLTAGTATSLAGGSGGTIPYQSAAGTTAMLANGTANQVLQSNGTTLAPSWETLAGGGDALVANPLSQFAATTSAQLLGVISNETGSGAAVFGTSPAITTPTGIVKGDVGLGNVDNTSDASQTSTFIGAAHTYTAGAKQTFGASATNAGVSFTGVTADPSTPVAGDLWYRTDIPALKFYNGTIARRAQGYVMTGGCATPFNPADNITYYLGSNFGTNTHNVYAVNSITVPRAGLITKVIFTCIVGTNGTNEAVGHYIRLNDTTDTTLSTTETYDPGTNTGKTFNYSAFTPIAVADNDTIAFKIVAPVTWATNPTLTNMHLQFLVE